jgi:hypothetical protein
VFHQSHSGAPSRILAFPGRTFDDLEIVEGIDYGKCAVPERARAADAGACGSHDPDLFLPGRDLWLPPLRIDQPALVTVSFNHLDANTAPAVIEAPDGILIDGPPVRVYNERQVSWRIRPVRPSSGELQWLTANGRVTKNITAGHGSHLISRRRTGSLWEMIRYPVEPLLGAGPIEWIEVSYPTAGVSMMGMEAHWSVWFTIFALMGAPLPAKIAQWRR